MLNLLARSVLPSFLKSARRGVQLVPRVAFNFVYSNAPSENFVKTIQQ